MRWLVLLVCVPLFGDPTVVSSDAARYDGEHIILRGHVHVEHEMGELFADRVTLTKDEEKQTKLDFPWIKLEDDVRFVLVEGRKLICANASCDYIKKQAYVEGGLHYSDQHGEIYARSGIIDYIEEDKKLKPTRVTLEGEVQMVNQKRAQYALADRVEYFPEKELMVMTAQKSVLFYDKERGMELSAKEVRARRDADGQDTVQGVGNVRFLFGAGEFEKLQGKFGL